jgi:sporulation protein YlmC with PRC-barrel domain
MRAIGIGLLTRVIIPVCFALSVITSFSQMDPPPTIRVSRVAIPHAHRISHPDNPSLWMIHHQLATKIRGMTVENRDGQFLGKVEDFIIDSRSGDVCYALISSGGFLGFSKTLRAVPAQILSTATAKRGVAALDVGRRRWDRAPRFKSSDLSRWNNDAYAAEAISKYYAQGGAGSQSRKWAKITSSANASPPSSEAVVEQAPPAARRKIGRLEFASNLFGKTVVDSEGRSLGTISDLLIDLPGRRPTLAILTPAKSFRHSVSFAISIFSLIPQNPDTLRIEANEPTFTHAPSLDDKAWGAPHKDQTTVIFRYPSTDRHDLQSRVLGTSDVNTSLASERRPDLSVMKG